MARKPKIATTNITTEHGNHFNALRNPDYDNFALFSCFLNGEPASAIVAITRDEEGGDYTITPFFVSITPSMVLTDHDGNAIAALHPRSDHQTERPPQ